MSRGETPKKWGRGGKRHSEKNPVAPSEKEFRGPRGKPIGEKMESKPPGGMWDWGNHHGEKKGKEGIRNEEETNGQR